MSQAVPSAILVVDNDELLLRAISRELMRVGFEVVTTSKPLEAVFMALSGLRFRAAILDVEMPDLTGLDLAAKLAGLGAAIPTIFMSAVTHIIPADGQLFVEKPFTTQTLVRALSDLGVEVPAARAKSA